MPFYQLRANYKGVLYPIEQYYDYSLKEALKLYRERHNLKYAKNIKFTQF